MKPITPDERLKRILADCSVDQFYLEQHSEYEFTLHTSPKLGELERDHIKAYFGPNKRILFAELTGFPNIAYEGAQTVQPSLPGLPQDNVAHPAHYNSGKIEVIEGIEAWGLGFHRGNAVKYIARAGKKDPSKEVEDLQKAIWYLEREIELLTKEEPRRPNDMKLQEAISLPPGRINYKDETIFWIDGEWLSVDLENENKEVKTVITFMPDHQALAKQAATPGQRVRMGLEIKQGVLK